jgi:hypothetical protein
MEISLYSLPYSLMTPSCGIIMCLPNTRKLCKVYIMGTDYDFYPDFICRKPKLKWNLMKFDFLRTQENDLNWCIPTARNTPTSGPHSSGTLQFETPKPPSSIPVKSWKCTSGQMDRLNRRCSTLTQLG